MNLGTSWHPHFLRMFKTCPKAIKLPLLVSKKNTCPKELFSDLVGAI